MVVEKNAKIIGIHNSNYKALFLIVDNSKHEIWLIRVMNDIKYLQAKRWLENYCKQANVVESPKGLHLEEQRPCLLLVDNHGCYLIRFCLHDETWKAQYKNHKGVWAEYPGLKKTNEWSDICGALEQAPLHVHWGE